MATIRGQVEPGPRARLESMDDPSLVTAGVLAGIVVGAAFSAIDAGLHSLGEPRLRGLKDGDGPVAREAGRFLASSDVIRTRLLVGRILAVSLVAGFSAYAGFELGGVPGGLVCAAGAGFVYAILAEFGATVSRRRAGRATLRLLRLLRPLEWLAAPFAMPMVWIARMATRWVPEATEGDEVEIAAQAVEHLVDEGQERGAIGESQANLLRNVLDFKDTIARQVMVPRTKTVAFEVDTPLATVLERIVDSGHSRYPVYSEHVDQPIGLLYAKDLFRILRDGGEIGDIDLRDLVRRPVYYAAESQKIGALLTDMQARRFHLAIVADEFGGTAGIVTLEDILEEIVGEILDEHDKFEPIVIRLGAGRWLVDAAMAIPDVEDAIGEALGDGDCDGDSLGGMIVDLAGGLPAEGTRVRAGHFDLLVLEADERRITRVEVIRVDEALDEAV